MPRAQAIMRGAFSRRAVLAGAGLASVAIPAYAEVPACKKGANNCYSSTSTGKNQLPVWQFPDGVSKGEALKTFAEVVDSYPQDGQAGVDQGGWSVVAGDGKSGNAKFEFKSGVGNFAKFFNSGKPFVDDVEFQQVDSGIAVFSSSRIGDSDFGVNAKRLNFYAGKLRAMGWNAPEVKALQ